MTADIRLVTYSRFPNLSPDDRPLADALRRRGATVAPACWDDTTIDWRSCAIAMLRSPWDYHRRPDAFLTWLSRAAEETRVVNSPALIRWNIHKAYLLHLAAAGVRSVPTTLLRRGVSASIGDIAREHGWTDVVIKPAISASSYRTIRVHDAAAAPPTAEAHLRDLLLAGDVLVQPFVREVETVGEHALVFIDGLFSHAFAKTPFDATYPEEDAGIGERIEVAAPEIAFAQRVMAVLPERPIYARIDLVPREDGPALMEVELIDPSLHFRVAPASAERMADVLIALLG